MLIQDERRQHSDELTSFHKQLLDQRHFYHTDLVTKLAIARQFVADFADLHMDLFTQQIADETSGYRDDMKRDDAQALQMLKDNELYRERLRKLEQQHHIYQMGLSKTESEHDKLEAQDAELEISLGKQMSNTSRDLAELRESREHRIGELRSRLRAGRERNVALKQEAAVASRALAAAEQAKYEHFRKEYEIMQSMSDAAVFLLTALDERFGPIPEEDAVRNQQCTLNKIIRKLASIKIEAKRRPVVATDTADAEVQTVAVVPPPPLMPPTAVAGNPRKRRTTQRFTELPIYQKLFAGLPPRPARSKATQSMLLRSGVHH
jgi:hypothetical protein